MPRKKWLLDRCGYPGQIVLSSKANYSFGRGKDNDHVLLSLFVSRAHCVFKDDGTNLSVTDLDSSNGTFVNEIRINSHEAVTLKENDVIGFGVTNSLAENFYVYKLTQGTEELADHGKIKTEEEKKGKTTVKQEAESSIEVIACDESIEVIELSDDDDDDKVGKVYINPSNTRFLGEYSKTVIVESNILNSENSKSTNEPKTCANTLPNKPPMLSDKVGGIGTEFENVRKIEPHLIGDSITESQQTSESRISESDCVSKRIKLENIGKYDAEDFCSVSDRTVSGQKQSSSAPLTLTSNPESSKVDIQSNTRRGSTISHEIPTCSYISDLNENKSSFECDIKTEPGTSSRISDGLELHGNDKKEWFTNELLPYIQELGSDTKSLSDEKDEKRKPTTTAIEEPFPKKMKLCASNDLKQKYPVGGAVPIVLVQKLNINQLSKSSDLKNTVLLTEKMDAGRNIMDKHELDKKNSEIDDNEKESSNSRFFNYSQSDDAIIVIDDDDDEDQSSEEPSSKDKVEDFDIKEEIFDDEIEEKDEEEDDDLVVQWASKLSQTFDDKLDNKEENNSDDESIICFSKNKRNRLTFPDSDSDNDDGVGHWSVLNDVTSEWSSVLCDEGVNKSNFVKTVSSSHLFGENLKQDTFKNSETDVQKSVPESTIKNIIDEKPKEEGKKATREGKQDYFSLLEPNSTLSEPNTLPEPSSTLNEPKSTLPPPNSALIEHNSIFPEPISKPYSLAFREPKSCTVPLNDGRDSVVCSDADFPSKSSSTDPKVHSLINTKCSVNKRTLLCSALPLKSRKNSKSASDKLEKIKSSLSVPDSGRKQLNSSGDTNISSNVQKVNANPVLCPEKEVNSDKEKRRLKLKAIAEKDKEKARKNKGKPQSSKPSKSIKNTKLSRADKLAELFVTSHPNKQSESLHKKKCDERERKSMNASSEKSHKSSKSSTSGLVSLLHSVKDNLVSDAQSETKAVPIKKLSFKDLPKIPKLKVPTPIDTSSTTVHILHSGANNNQSEASAGPSKVGEPLSSILRSVNGPYKKKKVTFASGKNLCSKRIFQVELGKGMRRVDAKDIPARRIEVQNAPSPFEVSTKAVENIITKILCLWNPRWLQEQKIMSKYGDIPPPCYGSKETVTSLVPMLTSFSNHKEYVTVLQPLMLLELWAIVSENADRPTRRSRTKFYLSVENVQIGNEITTLFCRMQIENYQELNFHRMGDLFHMYCPYQKSAQSTEQTLKEGCSPHDMPSLWEGLYV